MAARYRVGTSGWVYPHWKGRFYPDDLPERRWFEFYAATFGTVEINNTFYRLPRAKTVERWRAQAPPGFLFAVKAGRFLTHVKRLKDVREPLARFMDVIGLLGESLGPVLVQLPESFARSAENFARLTAFFRLIPTHPPFVMEFRHATWFVEDVYALMRDHGVGLCIASDPARPTDFQVTGEVVYVRFHGSGDKRYQGNYPEAELRAWARKISALARGRAAFLYFNNDFRAYAVANALRMRELLSLTPAKRATHPTADRPARNPGTE